MSEKYDSLTREQLIDLLKKRDRTKKLGLVWERDEIAADQAIDENFIACEIVPELSDKPAPWANMVIEGDNFDALRWLRMTLAGRVKCIYVDPPYNTGNKDWVYNDRYMDAEDRFRQSTWLEFLYRRFTLARDLLAEDGVMLVSINDEQRALLELMMDQAMPGMRIAVMPWRTRQGSNADQRAFMSPDHEHVLVYAKDEFRFLGNEKSYSMYKHFDELRDDWYRLSDLTLGFDYRERPNLYYPLQDPKTGNWYPCNPNSVWRYATRKRLKPGQRVQSKPMEEWLELNRIKFPESPNTRIFSTIDELKAACEAGEVPYSGRAPLIRPDLPDFEFWVGKKIAYGTPSFKRYKRELRNPRQPLSSWVSPRAEAKQIDDGSNTIIAGTNDEAAKEIKSVFGSKAFNYAKPVSLIRELVRQSTGPGDIVLDFFAGSATTAQAVMELNAEDGGGRHFIMVSSTEATEEEPDKNLCRDVTAERVRRLNTNDDPKYADLVAPFAYLRTREIAFEDLDYDLAPKDAWAALETLHGLPLTVYNTATPWNAHEGDGVTLVMVDRYDTALLDWLHDRSRRNVFVYSWAPGQLARELAGVEVEVRSVRDTLVRSFQQ
ncbi:site-specific DNA-methyltransferase [Pseudovibrio sp. SPO723]|uniref:site-specific DNA-methyltransferase n=1 Tax=Nesiotobacter zosterae TaxID=392721 RepID=UPI0029C4875E|nr:site-specific DNA-methyltransferase [Pseudovibrio sp. SPO723]MDX5595667.1 site-specific DNA-methyltransferase [Pseudovibrio sp. SPO723]